MILVNILALMIFFFSFLGGLKEGAVKKFFSLLVLIIALLVSGLFYRLGTTILSFLPGTNWENFFGFFIPLGIATAILHIAFWLPRSITQKIWGKGLLFRLLGGALNLLNASVGLTVLTLALGAFPIIDWLAQAVTAAAVPAWLVEHLGFVQLLLPEAFRRAGAVISASASFM